MYLPSHVHVHRFRHLKVVHAHDISMFFNEGWTDFGGTIDIVCMEESLDVYDYLCPTFVYQQQR